MGIPENLAPFDTDSNENKPMESSMKIEHASRHATTRSQQRGIPQLIITWLIDYGAIAHGAHGAVTHYFDHNARRRLAQEVGTRVITLLGRLMDAYLVMSHDGTIITVGHRFKAIHRA
jgi:hypothetical protein